MKVGDGLGFMLVNSVIRLEGLRYRLLLRDIGAIAVVLLAASASALASALPLTLPKTLTLALTAAHTLAQT